MLFSFPISIIKSQIDLPDSHIFLLWPGETCEQMIWSIQRVHLFINADCDLGWYSNLIQTADSDQSTEHYLHHLASKAHCYSVLELS